MRCTSETIIGCLLAGAAAIVLAACGSSSSSSSSSSTASSSSSKTIDIYSDMPLLGASTAQTIPTVNGMKLALSQAGGKAGPFTVKYISLNDASASTGNYDLGLCASDARQAATDPKAIVYLGTFNSGCAEVAIPILNQAECRWSARRTRTSA